MHRDGKLKMGRKEQGPLTGPLFLLRGDLICTENRMNSVDRQLPAIQAYVNDIAKRSVRFTRRISPKPPLRSRSCSVSHGRNLAIEGLRKLLLYGITGDMPGF